MIDFKGRNCAELQERIRSAGYWLAEVDGVWQADSADAVQAIIDSFTPAELADAVCAQIEALATAKRNAVVAPFSPGEMSSWPIKLAEARQFGVSGNPADAQFLAREAAKRGISLQQLVDKVIANAAQLSAIEADIAGVSGMHRDAVRALLTHEQVLAYDYTAGWPL